MWHVFKKNFKILISVLALNYSTFNSLEAQEVQNIREGLRLMQTFTGTAPKLSCMDMSSSNQAAGQAQVLEQSQFCQDPYLTICSDRANHESERLSRIEKYRQDVATYAISMAKEQGVLNDEQAASLTDYQSLIDSTRLFSSATSNLNLTTKFRLRMLLRLSLEKVAGPAIKKVEAILHSDKFETNIKWTLMNSLEDEFSTKVPKQTRFYREQQTKLLGMKKTIFATSWVTPSNIDDLMDGKDREQMESSIASICDSDGMSDNAFAQGFDKKNSIYICPGTMLAMAVDAEMGTEESLKNGLSQTLFHELAHTIDAKRGNPGEHFYRPLLACYENASANYGTDGYFPHRKGECTADHWATQAMIRYMKAKGDLSYDKKVLLLRQSYGGYCELAGQNAQQRESSHPSGRFRIEVLLAGDSSVRQLMGCDATQQTGPSCSIAGGK